MILWPINVASSYLILLLFLHTHIKSYCQVGFNTAFSYSVSGMTPVPVNHMTYAHAQPVYHLPQDKTEVIVVGDKGGKEHHHHHHHHHHKNIHHHHHGHKHSHGHNHNHDHKHDHDHKHGHNHNHKHGHNHNHKHDHGHNHQHNHAHGHLHNHGHNHDHKHAHIFLHRHGHRQKHSPNYGHINQQEHNYNNNYGSNNVQHYVKSNSYDQHSSAEQVNPHQLQHQFNLQNQQNNHKHGDNGANYPDHVPPSYISTENDKSISHNGDHNKVNVQYDEPERGNAHQPHYEHSVSNEHASYEAKEEDHTQSSENLSHKPDKESFDSSELADTSPRFSIGNLKIKPHTPQSYRTSPQSKSYSSVYQNTNIPKNHDDPSGSKAHDKSSEELSVSPQVHYGVRLGRGGYDDYHKKEASISSVSFLQENGEIITVGDDDPYVSVGKPLKLEDSNPQQGYHGESLESKLSAGRMTLTPARGYEASIGKVDEVWNIPLFD